VRVAVESNVGLAVPTPSPPKLPYSEGNTVVADDIDLNWSKWSHFNVLFTGSIEVARVGESDLKDVVGPTPRDVHLHRLVTCDRWFIIGAVKHELALLDFILIGHSHRGDRGVRNTINERAISIRIGEASRNSKFATFLFKPRPRGGGEFPKFVPHRTWK
jgi:hypothetical protein